MQIKTSRSRDQFVVECASAVYELANEPTTTGARYVPVTGRCVALWCADDDSILACRDDGETSWPALVLSVDLDKLTDNTSTTMRAVTAQQVDGNGPGEDSGETIGLACTAAQFTALFLDRSRAGDGHGVEWRTSDIEYARKEETEP